MTLKAICTNCRSFNLEKHEKLDLAKCLNCGNTIPLIELEYIKND